MGDAQEPGSEVIRALRPARRYDADGVRRAVLDLLEAIGEDVAREGLRRTPERVAEMYAELFAGLDREPTEVLDVLFDEGHDEMIMVRDIVLQSVCEHHLIPFLGQAHVAYIPNKQGCITGLSKIVRLVDLLARRPQVQERLTTQIADALEEALAPRGVLVVIEAEHLCMSMRGVRKPGSQTVTSAVRGIFRTNNATRAEAMNLIARG
jgi:GTP cyclohydrolase IA